MTVSEGQYLNQNLSLLKKNFPQIYEICFKDKGAMSLKPELLQADNGKYNLRILEPGHKLVYIHDVSSPGQEAEDFLSMVPEASTGVVIALGMGLGYAVLELLRQRKQIQYLVVFERNIEFFKLAMEYMDLSDLLSDNRVVINLGQEENLESLFLPMAKSMMLEDIHTLKLQTCFRADPDYDTLSSQVFSLINAYNTEGATKSIHGRTFVKNRLRHLTSMHHDRKLEELTGLYKGVTAIVVASGPSLDKNIDQVARAHGKAVLICADTALPNLLEHDILPDFVTAIDYQEMTYEKIANCASNKAVRHINLICTSWVTEMVPKFFPAKNVFWAFGQNPLENWINSAMGGKMVIPGAGTVAHLNFIAANTLGCSPIVFVGQDLAFSEANWYSKNVVLNNEEQTPEKIRQGKDIIWVKGGIEPEVPTNRQFYGYVKLFEEMIEAADVQVLNATEGGALIQGAPNMPLCKVIDQYCTTEIKPDSGTIPLKSKTGAPLEAVTAVMGEIKKLEAIIKKADRLSGPTKMKLLKLKPRAKKIKAFSDLDVTVQKKISAFDKCQIQSDKNALWPLFDEMTMDALRSSEREKRAIEQLAGRPEKYYEWLLKSLGRVDRINKIRLENLQWFKKELAEVQEYYKKETLCLKALENPKAGGKKWEELSRLYHKTRNYILLEKLMKTVPPDLDLSGEASFYQGVIALCQRDFKLAEECFSAAMSTNPEFCEMIQKERNDAGDYFWDKIKRYKGPAEGALSNIAGFLFLNGLRASPEHSGLKKGLLEYAQKDFEVIKAEMDGAGNITSSAVKELLRKWAELILAAPAAAMINDTLGEGLVAGYLVHHSQQLINNKELEAALDVLNGLRKLQSDNPEHYIRLADLSFSMEDFDSGVGFLGQAVGLDSEYAQYWRNMGDNLQSKGDFQTAILAYEQFFMALPGNFTVLKEIGDCHTKLGNLDAAQESYVQLKKRLDSEK